MARPTKYNAERHERVLAALRVGCTRAVAASAAHVDVDTLGRWARRYPELAADIRQAEAQAERLHTVALMRASQQGDWRASLEWLKRRRQADWGDRVAHDIDADIERLMGALRGPGSMPPGG